MAVIKVEDTPMQRVSPNMNRRMAYLDKLMVVVCDFFDGPMPEPDKPHSHPHEQITYVAMGELFVFLGEEKHRLAEGDMFSVPSGVPHCIQTISKDVTLVDSFCPVREEFLKLKT